MNKKTLFSLLFLGIICFLALPVFSEEGTTGEAAKEEAATAEPQAEQPAAPAEQSMPKYKASVIKSVQEALKTDGSYSGEATGNLDDATTEAIKKFQDKKGLKADGIPGPKTREALGIGAPAPKEEAKPSEEKKEEGKSEPSEKAPE